MLELTWLVPGDWSSYKEETRVEQILEEKYNVDLEVIAINAWDEEKVNVTLASGTYFDVFIRWGYSHFYKNNVIRAVPEDIMRKNMPNVVKYIDTLGGTAYMGQSI